MRQAIAAIIGVSIMMAVPATASAHGGGPESIVSFGGIVNSAHS
ncbi:MAG: hypothetical protein M0T85_06680 [Dehalococcoidales bacterium]|nr:hypothetical protein [Dehalococcoidales bacterium]